MPPRIAVVTGASSGIGHATAVELAERGYTVIGTSRNPDAVDERYRHAGIEFRALDLADPSSIEAFAADVGHVDVLVNNAGESQSGPIEELPADAVARLFQLNVLGAVRLTQLLLPGMREHRYGRVVMVGSMLASFPLAYRSSYVATKAAIKGFAEAARFETAAFGIWFTTVEPGSIKTGISARRTKYIGADSVYRDQFDTVIGALDAKEAAGVDPVAVAATIVHALESKRPKPLYAVGSRAPLVFALKRLGSRSFLERVVARQFRVRYPR